MRQNRVYFFFFFFFFNDTATTEIYTLSLHDALPIFVTHDSLLTGDAEGMSHQFGLNQTDQSDVFFQEDEAEADAIEYTPPNVDGEIIVLP